MAPGIFSEWRAEWRLRRGAAMYVAAISAEPEADDVQWLAEAATGDPDRARWELRYARRALGRLVADRDALDDRTGSLVAHRLKESIQADRNVAAGMVMIAEKQFNERLATYRAVLTARNPTEGTAGRLGRTLLRSARNGVEPAPELIGRAGEILARYLGDANDALRKAFGEATLPEDQPPSEAIRTPRS